MADELRKQTMCRLTVRFRAAIAAIAERKGVSQQRAIELLLVPGIACWERGGDPLPQLADVPAVLTETP